MTDLYAVGGTSPPLPIVAAQRRNGRRCGPCFSPHLGSVNYEMLKGASNPDVAKKYGFSKDAIRRHRPHIQNETNAIVAASTGKLTPEADALKTAQTRMAATIDGIRTKADALLEEIERQYERHKDGSVQDVVALLKENRAMLAEVAKLADAYPRANAVPVTEQHLHLHAYSSADLNDMLGEVKAKRLALSQ
jgi:hypothetical protein